MNSGQSRVLSFVLGALSAVLIVVGYRLWIDVHQGFPTLSTGRYIGTIQWEEENSEYFAINVNDLQYSFSFPGAKAGQIKGSFVPREDLTVGYYPLQIQSGDISFVFEGKNDDGRLVGAVHELTSGINGRWKLIPIGTKVAVENSQPELQLALVREEQYVKDQIEFLEEKKTTVLETIDSLEMKISGKDGLRSEAQKRYEAAESELDTLKLERVKYTDELEKIATQLELAKKVTKYGETIQLARQAANYDERAFLQQEGYRE